MEFNRVVTMDAPLDAVWALTNDLEAVAGCIPGVSEFEMTSDHAFDCRLVQKVGSVKANFRLSNHLKDVTPKERLTVVSEGKDTAINSSVRTTQTFELQSADGQTEVGISADIRVTGRIATFGGRIIQAKAEQVTVEALENVARLLHERQGEQ